MLPTVMIYVIIFLYGIVIGSFLNVCIYLVPLFSFLFLRGRCRKCRQKISVQYPVIELLNGVLYCMIFAVYGVSVNALLYALLASALIALSVIDFRTYEIPVGFNIWILALGLIRIVTDYADWLDYAVGFLAVSMFLLLIYLITKGRGIGGGDIKLMAACGLLLGWKRIILAFVLGCIIGSVVHTARMKISGQGHVLAFGPYLSVGVMIAALAGDPMIAWYLSFF